MALLVEHCGFTPIEAIRAATQIGAQAQGQSDTRGTIAMGMRADLVVLTADPTRRYPQHDEDRRSWSRMESSTGAIADSGDHTSRVIRVQRNPSPRDDGYRVSSMLQAVNLIGRSRFRQFQQRSHRCRRSKNVCTRWAWSCLHPRRRRRASCCRSSSCASSEGVLDFRARAAKPEWMVHRAARQVGREVTLEQGYEAARLTALSMLGSLQRALGDLDRIAAWTRVFGMVNSAKGFNRQPAVINGFSDLILELFGPEIGAHSRSAVGMAELPFNIPVEIEGEVELHGHGR